MRCYFFFLFSFSTLIGFQESGPSLLFATRQACGPFSLNRQGLAIGKKCIHALQEFLYFAQFVLQASSIAFNNNV